MKAAVKMLITAGLMVLAVATSVAQANTVRGNHSSVELVSEVSSIAPGQTFTIGLHVTPDSHWHNYWMNPGEAGKEMKVKWKDLPEGFSVGDFSYQVPHIVAMGDIVTYGYSEPNTILMDVTAPSSLAGDTVTLTGKASWLVCDDANCVPERGEISITLPVGSGDIDAGNAGLFKAARDHQPEKVNWDAAFYGEGGNVNFEIAFPEEGAKDFYVWPSRAKLIVHAHSQQSSLQGGVLKVSVPEGKRLAKYDETGLLITYTDANGESQAKFVEAAPKTEGAGTVAAAINEETPPNKRASLSLMGALGAALLGGLILNLMPCVLPVLSMKALSLVKLAEQHPRWVRENGLYYTIGVVLSFAILGGILLVLRALGGEIGWGFQLQNPAILLGIVLIMVLVGLNLLGVFEFGTSMMNTGADLTEGNSNKSAFFTGVLAVVVATPCMAPFMTVATGFALSQPAVIGMLVFMVLGLGLALPYLLVAFIPSMLRFLPQPGAWMQIFKEVMAFPMFATALYFLWVLGNSTGVMTMTFVLGAILMLAIAAWAWGRVMMSGKPNVWRSVAVLSLVGVIYISNAGLGVATTGNSSSHEGETAYSQQAMTELRNNNKAVFAYFTADWCVSCKVNEKASLHTETVQQYFADNGIEVVVGDWTDEDPEITALLEMYGRAGVPLYLYYKPGTALSDAKELPQILLTPNSIISEIEES